MKIARKLPEGIQQHLKRALYVRQITNGNFSPCEPEFEVLDRWISPDDWVIDVGANVGHYTARFSDLVGPRGHVLAVEPVVRTFELLTSNALHFKYRNVTLLNLAASSAGGIGHISVPEDEDGSRNYYQAQLTESDGQAVLKFKLDDLAIDHTVALIKVDAEGHDHEVLQGTAGTIDRDRPVVIIESNTDFVNRFFQGRNYRKESLSGSPNIVFEPQ